MLGRKPFLRHIEFVLFIFHTMRQHVCMIMMEIPAKFGKIGQRRQKQLCAEAPQPNRYRTSRLSYGYSCPADWVEFRKQDHKTLSHEMPDGYEPQPSLFQITPKLCDVSFDAVTTRQMGTNP
ncbi:hypothetical protein [Yoonia sp. SS1-5]|uniref:Uncharacterized protein n=1 Tax=Yoonia rhodophyticola TaxID=3137370 RepID=A0AAN0MAF0_9RHOB